MFEAARLAVIRQDVCYAPPTGEHQAEALQKEGFTDEAVHVMTHYMPETKPTSVGCLILDDGEQVDFYVTHSGRRMKEYGLLSILHDAQRHSGYDDI